MSKPRTAANVNGGLDLCPWRAQLPAMRCPRYHEVQAAAILNALASPSPAPAPTGPETPA